MRAVLGVNIDHVATIRQARGTRYPDPVEAAFLAEAAGADQITVHLREDRRHIQDRDVRMLRETVQTRLNLEMAATDAMLAFALEVAPDTVTLVPERREERTTEGGLDCVSPSPTLRRVVEELRARSIGVSLFIDPSADQVDAAVALRAGIVELHTGDYASAQGDGARRGAAQLARAAQLGADRGLTVAAGHGLTTRNIAPLLQIREIVEYNIGHSIVARATMVGLGEAVREMLAVLRGV